MYNDNYDRDYYNRPPSFPQLGPSPVCMGCEHNKMPYCFAPNSNDKRIDVLPSNFICPLKTMAVKEDVAEKAHFLVLISGQLEEFDKKLKLINTKLNRLIKRKV